MKISRLIEELKYMQGQHGDLEVTCTGSNLPDGSGQNRAFPTVFETTVEHIVLQTNETFGKHLRICL